MSIVEETLNRLGNQRPGSLDGMIPMDLGRLEAPPRRTAPRALFLAGALIAAGSAIWLTLEWHHAPGANLAETAAQAASRVPTPAPATEANPGPASPDTPAATTSSPAPETIQAAKTSATPAAPASAPVPSSARAQPGSPSENSAENRVVRTAPAWIAEGRKQLLAGSRDAALAAWNQGFASLPPHEPLIALSAHPDAAGALSALFRLEEFDGAFVAHATYRGKPSWRVLLFADRKQRSADMEAAVSRLGIKGGGFVPVSRLLPAAPVANAAAIPAAAEAPARATSTPKADFDAEAANLLAALDAYAPTALAMAEKLAHDFPSRVEPLLWRGRAELLQGRAEAAEKSLAAALERAPGLVEGWLLRGIAAQERQRHDEAAAFLEEARRLAPRNADVLFNLGLSARRAGHAELALEAWRNFLDLTRDKPAYANQREWVQRELARR